MLRVYPTYPPNKILKSRPGPVEAGTDGGGWPVERVPGLPVLSKLPSHSTPLALSLVTHYRLSVFAYLETPPDALILESPFTNIREEAKSHPFSVASTFHY